MKPVFFEKMACFEDCMVLYSRGYDVIPLIASRAGYALDRRIIAFRSPTGKNNFFLTGADELSSDVPRLLDGMLGFLTEGMEA
jgi:hypothetical protein